MIVPANQGERGRKDPELLPESLAGGDGQSGCVVVWRKDQ